MKKITKSKLRSKNFKTNPETETLEQQLKKLENHNVTIIVWDSRLFAPRAQLEGLLTKINHRSSKIILWGISKGYENIVFDINKDEIHIKNSKLIKETAILINFPKHYFED